MKTRPTFEFIYMNMALQLAKRSSCSRRQVGCVIASSDYKHVYGVGYNGNATKMPNGCDRPHASGNCGCLHAEENAIINCNAPRLVPPVPKIVFSTLYPCPACAKRLANLGGIQKVYYCQEYHNEQASVVFEVNGIAVEKHCSKGSVVEKIARMDSAPEDKNGIL